MGVSAFQLQKLSRFSGGHVGAWSALEGEQNSVIRKRDEEFVRRLNLAYGRLALLMNASIYKISQVRSNSLSIGLETLSNVLPIGAIATGDCRDDSPAMMLVSLSGFSLVTGFAAAAGFYSDRRIELRDLHDVSGMMWNLLSAMDDPDHLKEALPAVMRQMKESRIIFNNIPPQNLNDFVPVVEKYAGALTAKSALVLHKAYLQNSLMFLEKHSDIYDHTLPKAVSYKGMDLVERAKVAISFYPDRHFKRPALYERVDHAIQNVDDLDECKTIARRRLYLMDQDKRTSSSARNFTCVALSNAAQVGDFCVKLAQGAASPVSMGFNLAGGIIGMWPMYSATLRVLRTSSVSSVLADRLERSIKPGGGIDDKAAPSL